MVHCVLSKFSLRRALTQNLSVLYALLLKFKLVAVREGVPKQLGPVKTRPALEAEPQDMPPNFLKLPRLVAPRLSPLVLEEPG